MNFTRRPDKHEAKLTIGKGGLGQPFRMQELGKLYRPSRYRTGSVSDLNSFLQLVTQSGGLYPYLDQ